ncbi:hypothetical protein TWF703_006445 [Orbilia oligospora]|uniref:Acyl-CoA thioesterase 8 n=1 Tax=Orbilia oligospora TaxID=2813651 RepID=A0A7C8JNR8_ORBOL|nr:hypothetical protein TWF703_006445 [Orbilia oligospora]
MAPPATFVESMALQEVMISSPPDIKPTSSNINDAAPTGARRVFKSTGPAFVPIYGVYGGHLLGQSAYAAYKTVDKSFYCHSITGHFLVGGKPKIPFIYTVETLRQGKTYCTRNVQVRQPSPTDPRPLDSEVIFIATVSFKTVEPRGLESQVPPPKELKQWVSNPRGREIAPAVDVPSWLEFTKRKGMRSFYTAVDLRKVDVEEENRSRPLHEYRKYASDRNGMFAVTGPHNASDNIIHTGSLSHTLIFHANPDKLIFSNTSEGEEEDNPSSWTILEQLGDSASEGRGLIRSRIWSADGTLLASVMQDALIRVRVDNGEKVDRRKPTFSESLKI